MAGQERTPLPPGAVVGMLGGGQLGRMAALAAAPLGYTVHVFTDEPDSPAAQVCAAATVAAFTDHEALAHFAASVDVVTLEFENVPVETARFLAAHVPVYPDASALAVAQDRIAEKSFVNELGIATAPWRRADGPRDLTGALEALGSPAILKATRFGYDGKGQVKISAGDDLTAAWNLMGGDAGIVEGLVDFACEISVVLARGQDGATAAYPAVENRHRHHILDQTIAPAAIDVVIAGEAERIACRIVEALNYVGVLGVEMFVTQDGRVLVNEMAPRPHNSGHWTIDACFSSQFEQQIRAVCGLPLGSTERHADAVMTNLIGSDVERWPELVAEKGAKLHLYGKAAARPGRKMGHVTRLLPLSRMPP